MFEAPVDRFGGAVAGVGVIEVGQDVCGSALSVLPSVMSSVREEGTLVEVRRVDFLVLLKSFPHARWMSG